MALVPKAGADMLEAQGAPGLGTMTATAQGAAFEVLKPCDWPWDFQGVTRSALAFKAGNSVLASFEMRALKTSLPSAEALSQFVYAKSVEVPLRAGKAWRKFEIPFSIAADHAPGEAEFSFRLGFTPQSVEFRNLRIRNFGPAKPLSRLPRTAISYPGREKSAAWRGEALKRIQELRTAEFKLRVLDAGGKPVQGARVSLRQLKSAFRFGTAVSSKMLFLGDDSEDRRRYKETLARYFNIATEESALKWTALAGDLGPPWNRDFAKKGPAWVAAQGLDFRGHCLLWPSWRNSAKSAEKLKDRPEALKKAVLDHVRDTALLLKGIPVDWDVVNEPWDNREITDILGDGLLAECFRAAREADPAPRLFINDYAILEGGGGETTHRLRYEAVIRSLLAAEAPLDGIGIQGHFAPPLTAPVDMLQTLDRFAAFGKKILITEYDIEGTEGALAADFLRDLLLLCYSHPAVEGFLMWGFWDGKHWHKNAPLFEKDWKPKPALKVWEELVMKEWRTAASASSDAKGELGIRGHLGNYEIRVEKDGKSAAREAQLKKGGTELEIRL